MAFKAGLFRRAKGGWIVRIVIDIVMTGRAGIFQLLNMETVRDRNMIWVQIRRSPLDSKNTGVTADTVWINLVKLGREACMLFPTL
jgi:hypothetical protein